MLVSWLGMTMYPRILGVYLDDISWSRLRLASTDIKQDEFETSDIFGNILYLNWPDYGAVPQTRLIKALITVIKALLDDKTVEIGCAGAHGRTGTLLAALMVKIEKVDAKTAINRIRKEYCSRAIESYSQECMIYALSGENPPPQAPVSTVTRMYGKGQHSDYHNSDYYSSAKHGYKWDSTAGKMVPREAPVTGKAKSSTSTDEIPLGAYSKWDAKQGKFVDFIPDSNSTEPEPSDKKDGAWESVGEGIYERHNDDGSWEWLTEDGGWSKLNADDTWEYDQEFVDALDADTPPNKEVDDDNELFWGVDDNGDWCLYPADPEEDEDPYYWTHNEEGAWVRRNYGSSLGEADTPNNSDYLGYHHEEEETVGADSKCSVSLNASLVCPCESIIQGYCWEHYVEKHDGSYPNPDTGELMTGPTLMDYIIGQYKNMLHAMCESGNCKCDVPW